MTAAANAVLTSAKTPALTGGPGAKVAGVSMVAVLSALFWVAVIAAGANLLGFAVPAHALLATGAAIATFLAAVCAPLMLRTA